MQWIPSALDRSANEGDSFTNWLRTSARPLVLAFAPAWGEEDQRTLRAVRAELSALGASLFVTSERGCWFFQPDGDAGLPPGFADGAAHRRLRRRFRVAPDATSELTLLFFDEHARVTFRIATGLVHRVAETLLLTLTAARHRRFAASSSDQPPASDHDRLPTFAQQLAS